MGDEVSRAQQLAYIPIDRLHFDPENPRFPPSRHGGSEEDAFQYFLSQANLVDLMASIAAQGFFPGEPLLVASNDDGQFTVVEGNRRLAACRLLQDPSLAPTRTRSVEEISRTAAFRPSDLPALVFSDRSEILQFLGYRHISGIQEWNPVAKARHVQQLWDGESEEDESIRLRRIARRIGSRSDYVSRLLATLHFLEHAQSADYFGLALDEESIAFSLIMVALSRTSIAHFLGLSNGQDLHLTGLQDDRAREVLEWLFVEDRAGQTRLGESRNMKLLGAVIEDERALEEFRNGFSLHDAYMLAGFADDAIANNLQIARDQLVSALRQLDSGHEARQEDLSASEGVAELARSVASKIREQPRW